MFAHRYQTSILAVAGICLIVAPRAHAAPNPERQCQKARHDAAAKYTHCELKAIGIAFDLNDESYPVDYQKPLSKCRIKYAGTWAKLQAKASGTGTSCDQPRFIVIDGTVKDNLTGLQWEQKTDDGTVHDKDNGYPWSVSLSDADGPAFTDFLATLNGTCFAGQCDWRLPTRAELQTILPGPYPCASPCIDTAVFGPTADEAYSTSTPEATNPESAWFVSFHNGFVNDGFKFTSFPVRAVRGGW